MTAVEFLESQYNFNKQLFPSDFEQAKEMEKEQIKDAYDSGIWDVGCKAPNFDEYFNRTFEQE